MFPQSARGRGSGQGGEHEAAGPNPGASGRWEAPGGQGKIAKSRPPCRPLAVNIRHRVSGNRTRPVRAWRQSVSPSRASRAGILAVTYMHKHNIVLILRISHRYEKGGTRRHRLPCPASFAPSLPRRRSHVTSPRSPRAVHIRLTLAHSIPNRKHSL